MKLQPVSPLTSLISRDKITCRYFPIGVSTAQDATSGYVEWRVTLLRDGKELTCPLWTGGCEPTVTASLTYLTRAAWAVEWESYEGWLETVGEEDTVQNRAEYALSEHLAQALFEFLGRDHNRYNEYVFSC